MHLLDNKVFDIVDARCNHEDYGYVLHLSLIVCMIIWDTNLARMGRRNSHIDLFLKIQGKGMSSKLSAEMKIMSLIVRKECGGMHFIKLGRNSA